jgi:wyosine [tRNA(Phe)-imidazoG37] synthetase (radical SAM superfamily)
MYLDTIETSSSSSSSSSPQKLPPALEPLPTLETTNLTFIQTLQKDIDNALKKEHPTCLVFSGEGEPTLRWKDLIFLSRTYSSSQSSPIRVTTNGLLPSTHAIELKKHGVHFVTIALMTADSQQYNQLMKPVVVDSSIVDDSPHDVVCTFIQQAVCSDLDVQVTGVDRLDIDKEATEKLVALLGVTRPVRWRPYFI